MDDEREDILNWLQRWVNSSCLADRYLPLVDKEGGPDLVQYTGLSESRLRKYIRDGELKSWRPSPRGKILVRPSWFDEMVDRKIEEERLFLLGITPDAQRLLEKIFGPLGPLLSKAKIKRKRRR